MKRIIVTGCNGFIGKNVAEKFYAEGWNVFGVDSKIDFHEKTAYSRYQIDLLKENIQDVLQEIQPDVVIHCAGSANVKDSFADPINDFECNVKTLYKLLCLLNQLNRKTCRVIFLSSAAVYGEPERLPIIESSTPYPLSPYALHKKLAEDICWYFIKENAMDIKILRIFSAYGPGLKKQIFWDMGQKLLKTGAIDLFGTGEESRDFIYISDLMNAIYLIVCSNSDEIVYNVANGCETRIREIGEIFLKCMGYSAELLSFKKVDREGDPLNWKGDITRLKCLGYIQQVPLEDGIKNYAKWFQELKNE